MFTWLASLTLSYASDLKEIEIPKQNFFSKTLKEILTPLEEDIEQSGHTQEQVDELREKLTEVKILLHDKKKEILQKLHMIEEQKNKVPPIHKEESPQKQSAS